jgi:hypothetical protein
VTHTAGKIGDALQAKSSAGGASGWGGKKNSFGSKAVLIEEISEEQAASELQQQQSHELLLKMVLLSCTLAPDPTIFTPWAEGPAQAAEPHAAAAAAADLLMKLACLTCSETRIPASGTGGDQQELGCREEPTGSLALLTADETLVQRLLCTVAVELLPQLRRAVIAAQPHYDAAAAVSTSVSSSSLTSGAVGGSFIMSVVPELLSTYERAVFARATAYFVRALKHPFIGEKVRRLALSGNLSGNGTAASRDVMM